MDQIEVRSESPGDAGAHARFDAFISYNHANSAEAAAIQRGLHRLAKPVWRARSLRVFLDKTDLAANPALWAGIAAALDASRFLVAVLSPEAAGSGYVQRELAYWISAGRADRLLLVVAGGRLVWDEANGGFDPRTSTAAPSALCEPGVFAEEPLYVDLTWAGAGERLTLQHPRFRAAIVDLAAAVHGRDKAELDSEDIREHRRLRRLRALAVSALAVLLVIAVVAASIAFAQAGVATREAAAARAQAAVAEASLYSLRSTGAQSLWYALALAVEAETRTPEVLPESRDAMTRALQRLDRLALWPAGRPLSSPDGDLVVMGWSRDGRRLVTMVGDHDLQLWDATTATPSAPPSRRVGGLGTTWSAASGRVVAEVPREKKVRIEVRDLYGRTQASLPLLPKLPGRPYSTALSPNGEWLAVGGLDGEVLLYELSGQVRPVHRWTVGALGVTDMEWSPDGTRLAVIVSGDAWLLDVRTGAAVELDVPLDAGPVSLAWSPDGRRLAANGFDAIRIWKAADLTLERKLPVGDEVVNAVAWSPDGARLVSVGTGGELRLWDTTSGAQLGDPAWTNTGDLHQVAWAPDGRRLAVSGADGTVRMWEVVPGRPLLMSTGSESTRALAWSPGGDRLASVSELGDADVTDARVWDVASGRLIRHLDGGPQELRAVAWSPRGDRVAVAGDTGAVKVWDPGSGALLVTMAGDAGRINGLAWSPDGSRLAGAGQDGTVRIWDAAGGRQVYELLADFAESLSPVHAVAWSPDGNRLAAAGQVIVRLWDARTGKPIGGRLHESDLPVRDIAWSPRGDRVAAGGSDGRLRLWEAASGRPVRAPVPITGRPGLPGDERISVTSVAWKPDASVIATGDSEGMIRFFDAATLMPLGTPIAASRGLVQELAWSPDGRRLASAGGGVRLWGPSVDERTACRLVLAALGADELRELAAPGRPPMRCSHPESVATLPQLPAMAVRIP